MPEIEEREAAIFCGYNWREWLASDRRERITNVAHYRVHRLIELHQHDAISSEHDRQMNAAKAKRNGR